MSDRSPSSAAIQLLIVEDDHALSQMLTLHFEDQGYGVSTAHSCTEAIIRLADLQPDLILLDQQLPDGLGSELLPSLLEQRPEVRVIMMTGMHDLELAIRAIKDGAADFIHKPVKTDVLQQTVEKVLAQRQPATLDEQDVRHPKHIRELIGRSDAMLKVSKDIALSAESGATVLITGESGTGKEVVARLIHQHSSRKGPFVAINCAAIVDSLLESELFGHEKGAFTGATARKTGKFEQAIDGTFFLDEVAELAPQLQAKLLRALQERVFERVGGTESVNTNARVIAATHKDLFEEALNNNFREDLAYRLNVINIRLPALRERKEDVPLLAKALLEKAATLLGKPAPPITEEAMNSLVRQSWPGNVRELENVLTQALVHARDTAITPDLLTFREQPVSGEEGSEADETVESQQPLLTLDQVEAEHVRKVLDFTGGHKGNACRILGISRPALDRKIKKYQLNLPEKT